MHNKLCLLVLCLFINSIQAAHILSIFAAPLPSQYAFIEPLLKELAGRGHQITSISNFPQKEKVKNFHDIKVKGNKHLFYEFRKFTLDNIDTSYYDMMDVLYSRVSQMCINILSDPAVRYVLHNEKFDLIIFEVLFSEAFFGLSEYLNAPMVGVSTLGPMSSIDELVGNISPMSYIPQMILLSNEMKFWQRVLNVILNFVDWANYYLKYMPKQKQIYEFYFPNATLTFEEAQKNFSLVLLNDHFSLSLSRPYVPNMIEVAGLNVVTNPQPITPAVKYLLDNARDGAILMAFDAFMAPDVLNIFLKQFQKMPQIVLWKTSQKITSKPANVYINFDFNLPSILAHPNIKLYITSGGFLTVVESVYHGLPILGIFSTEGDHDYVDNIKKIGNGLSIKLHSISERILSTAFNELLATPRYRNIAKTLSHRFRDQQNTPMEKAVYWIEYVLRHNGAAHLRNKKQNMTWWQFYNVDVFLVILGSVGLVITIALLIIKILVKFLWKLSCGKKIYVTKEKEKTR